MTTTAGKRLLLGLTGGVAAYKSAELLRSLTKAGYDVRVVMTQAAMQFIGTATMQALSGQPVWTDLWDPRVANGMAHIDLSRDRDLIVVAPATADFMAKLVHGRADDLLSTLLLARECPAMLAPAMNRQMWEHPATQRNVQTLLSDGVLLAGPGAGEQACGEIGLGRMLEPEILLEEIDAFFQPKILQGRHVVMTAGPTVEPIDPVRAITNASSGKMGYALARAAREAGAHVLLISGPTALPTPSGVQRIDVRTAQDMFDAVKRVVNTADIFIGVAAVADYRAQTIAQQKIKKTTATERTLLLEENPDILAYVAGLPQAPFCVGFAAESEQLSQHASEKRRRKNIPLLIGNLAEQALGADDNAVTLFDDAGEHPLPRAPKLLLARTLIAQIAARLPRGSQGKK